MSYEPPASPPLPTFAIKDLCGPSNPPGLISISKRRYDATLKSTPDAALLYLDDDDGELITVGSGFELSQRLEEPVPKYIRELRDPADGKLVHVFDINHSLASLIEWRDHEAYSSKRFNSLSSTSQSPRSEDDLLPPSSFSSFTNSHITYPNLPEPRIEQFVQTVEDKMTASSASSLPQEQPTEQPLDILSGIEEHLSGLANVLQIAAHTLQKAADKTKETDTSVIEDILKGVKGILTEVGSFGVEAFKDLGGEIETATREQSIPDATLSTEAATAARLAQEAKEEHDARAARKEIQSSEALEASTYYNVETTMLQDTAPKVKFDLPGNAAQEKTHPLDSARPIPIHAQSARAEDSCKVNILKVSPASKYQHPSFLDDSSEDADFTARYPPLTTVRRARSTADLPLHWSPERKDRARKEADRRQRHRLLQDLHDDSFAARDITPSLSVSKGTSSAISPFCSPPPTATNTTLLAGKPGVEDKAGNVEVDHKPLPGAWPDVKIDANSSQAPARESSGDFFYRMTGRLPLSPSFLESGLQRSNTTASSNPASRLNGPFDPGFPYDASPSASRRPGFSRLCRGHRQSAGFAHNRYCATAAAPSGHGKQISVACEGSNSSVPASQKVNTPSDSDSRRSAETSRSQFESHRAVKHHRSVPQFQASSPLPYQIMRPHPFGNRGPRHAQRGATDFLSGPPMPMPPPMPFTTKPSFPPRTVPSNLWAPWQSSPPAQPHADEGTNVSSMNENTVNNDADSPVSSQSTVGRDLEFPSNEPPFPSGQPQRAPSPSLYRYPTPPRPAPPPPPRVLNAFWPPAPFIEPMQIEPMKDKIDECVDQLKMCGFGIDDENLKNRLHVYAVAADGDVTEAVEMIEQDRRMTAPGRFD